MYYNCAVLGYPLLNNQSNLIFNKLLCTTGINGGFSYFEVKETDELPLWMHLIERYNFKYISIASVHKRSILKLVEDADPSVIEVGAANTLKLTPHGWKAYNTECYAIYEELKNTGIFSDVLIIGAGAGARAVIWALQKLGIKTAAVVNRHLKDAKDMQAAFDGITLEFYKFDDLPVNVKFNLIINTIPIGWDNSLWISRFWPGGAGLFFGRQPCVVLDLLYDLECETPFLSLWDKSCKKIDGFSILAGHAKRAFSIWFDKQVSCEPQDFRRI